MELSYLTYQADKKGKCSLCNSRKRLSTLVLIHDAKQVYGDLIVCDECRWVLEQAVATPGIVETEWNFRKEG